MGRVTRSFEIVPASLSNATVTIGNASYKYTGSAQTPTVKVTLGGKTLVKGTDYTVKYSNNSKKGKATITVTGTGNYTGTATGTFIVK